MRDGSHHRPSAFDGIRLWVRRSWEISSMNEMGDRMWTFYGHNHRHWKIFVWVCTVSHMQRPSLLLFNILHDHFWEICNTNASFFFFNDGVPDLHNMYVTRFWARLGSAASCNRSSAVSPPHFWPTCVLFGAHGSTQVVSSQPMNSTTGS